MKQLYTFWLSNNACTLKPTILVCKRSARCRNKPRSNSLKGGKWHSKTVSTTLIYWIICNGSLQLFNVLTSLILFNTF